MQDAPNMPIASRDIHCFHGDQLGLVEEDLDQVCRCKMRVL